MTKRHTTMVGLALIMASVSLASDGAATATYVIQAGEIITDDISAQVILLNAGDGAFYDADVTLSAAQQIEIRGALTQLPGAPPRDIILASGQDIIIHGA